jgi:inhibitor of KinA
MKLAPIGDSAVLVTLGETPDAPTVAAARALVAALDAKPLAGFVECAQANTSVTVFYDPARVPVSSRESPFERVGRWIESRAVAAGRVGIPPGRQITVPVCYGGEFGLDLEAVGAAHGLTCDEVVALPSSVEYFVSAIGFIPGFAYLRGLPERLHTPRRTAPRTRVAAGSVAIGGTQTGIYPFETPGGWSLIGCTPWRLFNPYSHAPSFLQVGDRVRFRPIAPEEYGALRSS